MELTQRHRSHRSATAAICFVVACSSNKPRGAEDAAHVPRADATLVDVRPSDASMGSATPVASTARRGDLQVRVEWKNVPVAMRASPGRTACKTARPAAVAPTTTWGIPDVVVFIDGAVIPPTSARVVLADCVLAPRVLTTSQLVLESAVDRPARVTFAKRATIDVLAEIDTARPRTIQLPIAGHAVALPLDDGGVYELAAGEETAWVIASAHAGVTEANGALLVKDLAPGSYAVRAWLPPRAGAPSKLVKGTATVVAGDLAELVIAL